MTWLNEAARFGAWKWIHAVLALQNTAQSEVACAKKHALFSIFALRFQTGCVVVVVSKLARRFVSPNSRSLPPATVPAL